MKLLGFFRKRKSPYIEVGKDMRQCIRPVFEGKNKQADDFVDTIVQILLVDITDPHKICFELMKCGFKVPEPILMEILIYLDAVGIIAYRFEKSGKVISESFRRLIDNVAYKKAQ
jgi:hypothetical protein